MKPTVASTSKVEQFCTFYLERSLFGVEVGSVQEVIRSQDMSAVPLAPSVVRGLINLRGQIVTALDLRRCLGWPQAPEGRAPMNVVVRSDEGAVSLLVDEIGDVLDIDSANIEAPPVTLVGRSRELIRGVVQRERGVLLVLDIARTLETGD